MTPVAITFLVLAALIIWGGLIVSIVLLRRDVPEAEYDTQEVGAPQAPRRTQPRRTPRAERRKR